MVPREEIEKEQPTTLPADFGEWDSGEPPEKQPADFNGFDRLPDSGKVRKPPVSPAPVPAPAAVRPRAVAPPPKPVASTPAKADVDLYRAPRYEEARHEEEEEEPEGKGKKKLVFASIGVVALLLVGIPLGYFKLRPQPVATNQPTVSQQTIVDAQKPTPATSATNGTQAANQPVNDDKPAAATTNQSAPLTAQTAAMNHQLSAPSRIPSDLKTLAGKDSAPSSGFNATGLEGMGNGGGNVFGGQSGAKVKVRAEAPKKVNISAGIAVGLLIKKTPPMYPSIARNAHVSGTVVLQATISKSGAVENVRAISGPAMLRQSAQDAVRTWRFRPYLLDGEPVEVGTVVNVTFALTQ
jgi:TonB family protein